MYWWLVNELLLISSEYNGGGIGNEIISADEGTIQDNNLGQSSSEPILQEEQESESRHEEEKGMVAEPSTTITLFCEEKSHLK